MIKLHQDSLPLHFTVANSENSWYLQPVNVYDFVSRDSPELLVTVGDSWTWGSDISLNNRDHQYRRDHVWGSLIAKRYDYDWLNLSLCAQGNFWIASMVDELCDVIPALAYKKIHVVCVFTGIGRWFNTKYDVDIDYTSWFKENLRSKDDFDRFLTMLNARCVDQITNKLLLFPHVNLKIATNFVDHLGFDDLPCDNLIKDPWYRVLGLQDTGPVYTCTYYDRMHMIVDFINQEFHDDFKKWFINLTEISSRRIALLKSVPGFRNYHPTETYHQIWADYLHASNIF